MKKLGYSERIIIASQQIALEPGTVSVVRVEHADHCPMLRGKPICKCTPDIFINQGSNRIRVMADGSIRRKSELN